MATRLSLSLPQSLFLFSFFALTPLSIVICLFTPKTKGGEEYKKEK